MKSKLFFVLFSACLAVFANAQTEVRLMIQHKLGNADFAMNQTATNNLGNEFQMTRMDYYLTKFTIMHDGGQTIAVNDTFALISAGANSFVSLGDHNVTNVEGIKFYVGVHTPYNHQDPGNYPSSHPLAPKFPSMHWGWSAGYRFIAFEGVSGPNFGQTVQLHGLGDSNYKQTTVATAGFIDNGVMYIAVEADYIKGIQSIDVSQGNIYHGEDSYARDAMVNFNNNVFTASSNPTVSIEEIESLDMKIYPVPANGIVTIETSKLPNGSILEVLDLTGRVIETQRVKSKSNMTLNLTNAGTYIIQVIDQQKIVVRKTVINH